MNVLRKTPELMRVLPGIVLTIALWVVPTTPAQALPTCISGVHMQCHRYWQSEGYDSEAQCNEEELPIECPGCIPDDPTSPFCTVEL